MSGGNGRAPRRYRPCPVGFECRCVPFTIRTGGTSKQRAAARRKRMQCRRKWAIDIPTRTVKLKGRR